MVDRIGVLMLDQLVQVVVSPSGPLAVGVVLGLGHLLGGLLELVLQLHQDASPDLTTSIMVSPGSKSGSCRNRLTRMPGPDEKRRRNRAGPCRPGS